MGELIDFAAYKKQKEKEELEELKKQVDSLLSQHEQESSPRYSLKDSTDLFSGASIYSNLDGYPEWWGTEEEFSYYPDYGEED
jgi:TATA-binding protein-associated factor Taf7